MQRSLSYVAVGLTVLAVGLFSRATHAGTLYGSLFEVGNLTSATVPGNNYESILTYYPGTDGFIGITSSANDTNEVEWWISDVYGTNWEVAATNPLDDYNCRQPGRHGTHVFNDEVYFTAACEDGGLIFKLTGQDSVSLEHTRTGDDGYPVTYELNSNLYFFYNGGYTVYDGTSYTDVTTATNQPTGVPFESSSEFNDSLGLAFSSGEVMLFDGTGYTQLNPDQAMGSLTGIALFNDTLYVGNQDMTNGATVYKYVEDNVAAGLDPFETVLQLDPEDIIINKMLVSQSISGNSFLTIFTSNSDNGTNVFALDASDTQIDLITNGLGGTNPENNAEVVDVVKRTITVSGNTYKVMLFATQNRTDETKIFVLALGNDFAFTPLDGHFVSGKKGKKFDAQLSAGSVLKVRVPKSKVNKGDVFSLWVDSDKVFMKTATGNGTVTLRHKAARKLDSGDSFTVQVGRRMSYGTGATQVLASNIVWGDALTVQID